MKKIKKKKYHINLNDIPPIEINHGTASKKVFIENADTNTDLTQFAWSVFRKGDSCEEHIHPTMDEYFFVLSGSGLYKIENQKIELKAGDFLKIPAGTPHSLKLEENHRKLELLYFGIATDAI